MMCATYLGVAGFYRLNNYCKNCYYKLQLFRLLLFYLFPGSVEAFLLRSVGWDFAQGFTGV